MLLKLLSCCLKTVSWSQWTLTQSPFQNLSVLVELSHSLMMVDIDIILISNQARSHTLEYHETGQHWLPWPCCDASHVQLPSVRGQSRFLWNVNSEEIMKMRTVVIVLMSSVMMVTSDLVLVTSLEDNSIPVFEVYNPSMDQVDVVLL